MLVQTEATIFTLVLTFLFAIAEFTNSTYTPRLSKYIFNRISFKALIVFSLSSIVIKIFILADKNFFSNDMINWSLFFSIIFILIITWFVVDVFSLTNPENLVAEALKQYNLAWIKTVNTQWGSREGPKIIFTEMDPLIPIERILVSALNHGDLTTFTTGLIQIREKLTSLSNEIDKIALDNYLAASLEPVIYTATKNNLDLALLYMCNNLVEITKPPLDSLRIADTRGLQYPPGCSLLMKMLDASVEAKLINSVRRALILTSQRTKYALSALPPFSDVWLTNPKNFGRKDIDKATRDKFIENEQQVTNFQERYLGYFIQISKRSLDLNLINISSTATSFLFDHIVDIAENIPEEDYQSHLISSVLLDIDRVVYLACDKKIRGAIRYGFLPANLRAFESENIVLLISNMLTSYFISMAKADILDYSVYYGISTAAISASLRYPKASLIFLNAFSVVGGILKSNENLSNREDLLLILQEMYFKIDNIDSVCQTSEIKTKVSRLAKKIKKEIKT